MPYIVPSTVASASCSTVTPPLSPSRPPLALSMALASPAPVPVPASLTPPQLPTSPRATSFSEVTSQSFGLAAREVHYLHPLKQPVIVKSLSETNSQTSANSARSLPPTSNPSAPPQTRRAVSNSNTSSTRRSLQHSNFAGNSLPRVPRRRTGGAITLKEVENQSVSQQSSSPLRGRLRSHFVVGSEEESGSGGGEEYGSSDRKTTEEIENVEECSHRNQPVVPKQTSTSTVRLLSPPQSTANRGSISDGSASDSETSDCATPTQRFLKDYHRPREPVSPLDSQNLQGSSSTRSSIAGVAPRSRRGRTRDKSQRLVYGSDSEDEVESSKVGQSTVEFPTSNPPSPSPSIAVNTPTPEMTPLSSPLQESNSKSFSGRRANAESLRLDFSFGSRSSDINGMANGNGHGHSNGHGRTLSESASLNDVRPIRKKSGEIVRPSLKLRSSSVSSTRERPSLSLGGISSLTTGTPSISAPTTPISAKTVHFDAQLEHIKIFKSTSRPAAVSRDGSPTCDDTTSGGEGDSASEGSAWSGYIPRPRPRLLVPGGSMGEEEEAVRRVLMLRVLNMPHRDPDVDDADVRLECLHLTDDVANVQGIVRVRNIAFEKTVAVRFTFDGWQTTSEVLGVWLESYAPRKHTPSLALRPRAISDPISGVRTDDPFDRFTFSIHLADLLLRIDEKTLVLAVRYNSAGREMWDNNDGQNYRAVFERRPQHSLTLSGSAVVPPGPDQAGEKHKGDDVGGSTRGSNVSRSNFAASGRGTAPGVNSLTDLEKVVHGIARLKENKPLSPIKKTSDLSSRYDIDSSLKNPSSWKPSLEKLYAWAGHGARHDRMAVRSSIPQTVEKLSREGAEKFVAEFFNSYPFESYSLDFNSRGGGRGSPRDLDRDTLDDSEVERFSRARLAAAEDAATSDEAPLPRFHPGSARFASPPSSWVSTGPEPHARNHHRSSYFDLWASSGGVISTFGTGKARLTPPGTPGSSTCTQLSDSNVDDLPLSKANHSERPRNSSPGRCSSFPPLIPVGYGNAYAGLGLTTARPFANKLHGCNSMPGDSEASTPSITSVSSPTTTTTESPSSPPELFSLISPLDAGWSAAPDNIPQSSPSLNKGDYRTFVNNFRLSEGRLGVPGSEIRRSYSESEVQDLLFTPPSPSSGAIPSLKESAPVPVIYDSRAATPTPGYASEDAGLVPPPPSSTGLLETEASLSTRVRC